MLGWVLRRLATGFLTLVAVSTFVFLATQALPGDAARAFLGTQATPERLAALQTQLGLDQPIVVQYGDWLGGLLRGDLGESLIARVPVSEFLHSRLINSLALVLLAAVVSIPLSILVGVYSAVHRDSPFDKATLLVTLVITSLPIFVIGLAIVIVFGTIVFQILPAVAIIPPGDSPFSHVVVLILPVAALVLAVIPYLSRLVRGSMIEVLESEYVQMARLKGMPDRIVIYRHALPNALIPAIQGSALVLAYLLSGVVLIEFLFAYPGLGTALTHALLGRDLPVIQAVTMIFASGVLLFNLLADVLTVLVTPKLRSRARSG